MISLVLFFWRPQLMRLLNKRLVRVQSQPPNGCCYGFRGGCFPHKSLLPTLNCERPAPSPGSLTLPLPSRAAAGEHCTLVPAGLAWAASAESAPESSLVHPQSALCPVVPDLSWCHFCAPGFRGPVRTLLPLTHGVE